MKMKLILSIILTGAVTFVQAQNAWNWPEDKQTAEEKNAIYTDYLKQEDYRAAANELHWLLENAPDLNPSIYINGAKIYESLATETKDKALEDSTLLMYDLRMEYFNEEASVIDRKAYTAYRLQNRRPEAYADIINMFEKTFEMNGKDMMDNNLLFYMDMLRRAKSSNKADVDEDIILERYEDITAMVDEKLAAGGDEARLNKLKDQIDGILSDAVTIDCNFIEKNLAPKLKEDDVKTAKKIVNFSIAGKCTDADYFLEAAEIVHSETPDYGIAKVIAVRRKSEGDLDKAERYMKEAIELTSDNAKKAEGYMELADIANRKGSKGTARDYYKQAINADNGVSSKAYTQIGNLYFTSFDQCKGGEDPVQDRGVYLIAYEMYKRAGNTSAMQNAQEQFPSMEDIFNFEHKVGDSISVGCWINESAEVRRR